VRVDTPSVADGFSLSATTKSGLRLAGFAWAARSISIFSGWFVVTRFGMTHELRIWDIMALRFGGGTLVLLPFLIENKGRPLKAGVARRSAVCTAVGRTLYFPRWARASAHFGGRGLCDYFRADAGIRRLHRMGRAWRTAGPVAAIL
jgi:hypothetical protein